MSRSENPTSDDDGGAGQASGATDDDASAWFARSTLRIGLAVVGFVLLLFALGQAIGMDLLGLVADALGTRVGRWLVVALFALVLIVVALRGFGARTEQ